jgi:hypothetical protein
MEKILAIALRSFVFAGIFGVMWFAIVMRRKNIPVDEQLRGTLKMASIWFVVYFISSYFMS